MTYIVSCETLMIYMLVIDMGSWTPKEHIFAPKQEDYPKLGYKPPIGRDREK